MNSYKNQNAGAGLFLIITLIFLGISIWQTALGYKLMFGSQLSWIFSLAIGVMMLYLAFEMRKRRIQGLSAIGPLAGYVACAIFCFFGNFNAIYSRYNKEELFTKELMRHKEEFTAIVTNSTTYLENIDPKFTVNKTQVLEHKNQLIAQILNRSNSGKGNRANEEIVIIGDLLGQKLTEFSGPPRELADEYSKNIDNILQARASSGRLGEANIIINEIKLKQEKLTPIIMDALKPQNISLMGQNAIFQTVDAINEIGSRTKFFLGKESLYEYLPAKFENQEIGKISHTFSSAFNGDNWATAFISIVVAFAIDALVPFVIFVGTSHEEDGRHRPRPEEDPIHVIK